MADETIPLALTRAEHRTLRLWMHSLATGCKVWLAIDSADHKRVEAIHLKLRANAILEDAPPRKGLESIEQQVQELLEGRDTDKQVKDVAWAILQSLHDEGSVMSWSDVSQKQEARLYDAARAAIKEFQK